jgi:hypothetical protein
MEAWNKNEYNFLGGLVHSKFGAPILKILLLYIYGEGFFKAMVTIKSN